MKKSGLLAKIFLSGIISFSFLAVVTATVSWFINKGLDSKKEANGVVGLRSYFYSGDGLTEETAYEITTPTHMYNLSMLQNIGLFPEKRYFRIGHKFTEPSVDYKVIVGYDENDEPIWGDELDMSTTTIAPIGNEATPFMGEFRGHGIPVSNIHVKGNPEDIGFFGYVGYDGDIEGLVLKNATIESLGYNSVSTNKQYSLYYPDIEDLYFQSAHYFEKFTRVKFYGYNASSQARDAGTVLTQANGLGGSPYANINSTTNGALINVTKEIDGVEVTESVYNGYFEIKFPQDFLDDPNVTMSAEEREHIQKDPFKYKWVASTSLISDETCIDINADTTLDTLPMINLTKLLNAPAVEEGDFNLAGVNSKVKTRLYLYATVEDQNFTYSRVIQAYSLEFSSNKDKQNTGYSVAMYCDYVATEDENHTVTNYHHGNNIGFLAGHLDGNMSQCYVYGNNNGIDEHGSHLIFNSASGMNPIYTTSDIGLIGEVGEGVYNKIDPDIGVLANGDIGVMNFTKIYKGIRSDFTHNNVTKAGHNALFDGNNQWSSYVCYSSKLNTDEENGSLFNNYKDYLRYSTVNGQKQYFSGVGYTVSSGAVVDEGIDDVNLWHNHTITNSRISSNPEVNSVDFLWNKLIQDETESYKGLGVFKIATIYDGSASNPDSLDMYKSLGKTAIVNGQGQSKVYFSTAEYDYRKNSGVGWNADNYPVRASTLPSYADMGSFDYNFERDYNYCFELDLSQIGDTNGFNFMSNTDSPWLSTYLQSKLINAKGEPLAPGTKRFGFMFRSSDSAELEELSSYMAVGYPKSGPKASYNGSYYPSNSIVFKIDNEAGANVSVVARRNDVTIYSHHSNSSSQDDIEPLYAMRATPASKYESMDAHRYFKFDVQKTVIEDGEEVVKKGVTGTEAVPTGNNMIDDEKTLYAHIFKLDKGEYVIGSSGSGVTSDIFYLAVNGQNDGDIGSDVTSEVGNVLDEVDFLTEAPTKVNYPNGLTKANLQFFGEFNTTHGDFEVNLNNVSSVNRLALDFEGPDDPMFVTKLHVICDAQNPHYYVRGTKRTDIFLNYRS